MKYLLDTINKQEILECIRTMPISGVTSNPTIIKRHGKVDFFPYFSELSALLGARRTLHIQVTSPDAEGMLREAEAVTEKVGPGTYIKVPVNEAGLEAISCMKKAGLKVTATGIYTKTQAFMALEAGADFLAMYWNRMESLDIDAFGTFAAAAQMIDRYGYSAEILGASFKNITQVNSAFEAGAQAVTVTPQILKDALRIPVIDQCVKTFASDWEAVYGNKSIADL